MKLLCRIHDYPYFVDWSNWGLRRLQIQEHKVYTQQGTQYMGCDQCCLSSRSELFIKGPTWDEKIPLRCKSNESQFIFPLTCKNCQLEGAYYPYIKTEPLILVFVRVQMLSSLRKACFKKEKSPDSIVCLVESWFTFWLNFTTGQGPQANASCSS